MLTEDFIYEEIGKRIKNARESKGWTQQEFGDLVGLTRTSITNIERGKQKVPIDGLYKFAYILDVSPFSLLPEEDSLLDNIKVPGLEDNLDEVPPDILKFLQKVYVNFKRNEGDK